MLNDNDKKYFNTENWHMSPYGENGVLFTAEYLALKGYPKWGYKMAEKAIKEHINEKGEFYTRDDEHLSHDNLTAIICLSHAYGLPYTQRIFQKSTRHAMLHPRDFIFAMYARGGWCGILGSGLFIIPMVSMLVSCVTNVKKRGGRTFLKTDGKLLTWLRLKTFKLPVTRVLCNFAIKRNDKFEDWKSVFNIYFQNPFHPNNNQKASAYDL